jgi:ElaB/YqjD/DUF883 family membrane-anchored ribosome-binding protein
LHPKVEFKLNTGLVAGEVDAMPQGNPEPFANQELQAETPLLPADGTPAVRPAPVEVISDYQQRSVADDVKRQARVVADKARGQASVAYDQAQKRLLMARAKARDVVRTARYKGAHYAANYPGEFIATVAGAAFVAGVLVRVWRSSRYE